MSQTKLLIFAVLLLTTPSIYGQNRGSGDYKPSDLVQEFKDVHNNLHKMREFSKAVEKKEKINPKEFKDASKRTVIMVFNHAVNNDNYDAAKVMLNYLYENKYDKSFISKHKTMALGRIIRKSMHFVSRDGVKCYFRYDISYIDKWAQLLIDKNTDFQYLFEKTVNLPRTSLSDKNIALNTNEVIGLLRNYQRDLR